MYNGHRYSLTDYTPMSNRTEQLHQLMAEHGLTPKQVGELLNRSEQTVRIWRCKDDKRQIPEHALELLQAKVAAE